MIKRKYEYAQGVGFMPVECPVCHKSYVPAPEHAYRDYTGKRLVCSYHCMLQSRRDHAGERKTRAFYAERR